MADVTISLGYGRKMVTQDFFGPAAYVAGGFIRRMSGINRVLKVLVLSNDGGYKTEPADATIANNTVTIVVRQYPGALGPAIEVPNGTALDYVTFQVCVIGL